MTTIDFEDEGYEKEQGYEVTFVEEVFNDEYEHEDFIDKEDPQDAGLEEETSDNSEKIRISLQFSIVSKKAKEKLTSLKFLSMKILGEELECAVSSHQEETPEVDQKLESSDILEKCFISNSS